jgi:predicted GNAT family acetyltransferase
VAAGYNSLQSIVDASATEIASAAHINKQRVDRLQKGIVELIGDSLTLERQQLARLRTAGEPTIVIESLYALKGTPLEQAIENLLVAPFCPLKVARIANQREGEADLRIILSDGSAGIAQVTAKDNPTDKIGIVKATAVLSQSPNLKPRVFICIGRPDFLPDAIKKASDHVANKMNFKLIPICVLAEMYVRFRENRISAERVQNILESETGYIDFSFL